MRVLVACEFSGEVRDAFIRHGHNAISCDLQSSYGIGPHYQGDVKNIIDDSFDMLIAFPPCTYLAYIGMLHWNDPGREEKRNKALDFVRYLMNVPIHRIAIENPRGCIGIEIRKSDQIIQPYMFGHSERKQTHLWLKNLPPLISTCNVVNRVSFVPTVSGKNRQKVRSKTFSGIAEAMAQQWGGLS